MSLDNPKASGSFKAECPSCKEVFSLDTSARGKHQWRSVIGMHDTGGQGGLSILVKCPACGFKQAFGSERIW